MVDKMLPVPPSFYGWVKYEDAQNAEVKIMILPQGKDPDEVIIEQPRGWQKLTTDAKPMVDFIFESAVAKLNPESARDKSIVVEKLLPLLNEMKDPIRQAHYLERLSRLLKIEEHVLSDSLRKFKAIEKKRKGTTRVRSFTSPSYNIVSSSPLEQYCLALLLQYPELRTECTELASEHFENTENREIFAKWQNCDNLATLRSSLDSTLQEHLNDLISKIFPSILTENESARRETIEDCVTRLQERRLRNLESQKQELLAIEAEIGGTEAQLAKLEEGQEIPKQLKEIFIKQNRRHRQIKSEAE